MGCASLSNGMWSVCVDEAEHPTGVELAVVTDGHDLRVRFLCGFDEGVQVGGGCFVQHHHLTRLAGEVARAPNQRRHLRRAFRTTTTLEQRGRLHDPSPGAR